MANSQDDAAHRPQEITSKKPVEERRGQARSNTILSRIEDMTYEILRKHEKTA